MNNTRILPPAPAFPRDPLLLVYWKALHSLLYPEYSAAPTPTPGFPRFPTGRWWTAASCYRGAQENVKQVAWYAWVPGQRGRRREI